MKYAYVMSKTMRSLTLFDFTDKTATDLMFGGPDTSAIYAWDINKVPPWADYVGIETITSRFNGTDLIVPSNFLLEDIKNMVITADSFAGETGPALYTLPWHVSFAACYKMFWLYSRVESKISLEDLIEAMQK